jgi:hypothetical protein
MLQKLIWILHILLWLYTHVSSVFFKCFIGFQSYVVYVASILARYFKSRYGGAHVAMAPVARGCGLPQPPTIAVGGSAVGHRAGA